MRDYETFVAAVNAKADEITGGLFNWRNVEFNWADRNADGDSVEFTADQLVLVAIRQAKLLAKKVNRRPDAIYWQGAEYVVSDETWAELDSRGLILQMEDPCGRYHSLQNMTAFAVLQDCERQQRIRRIKIRASQQRRAEARALADLADAP